MPRSWFLLLSLNIPAKVGEIVGCEELALFPISRLAKKSIFDDEHLASSGADSGQGNRKPKTLYDNMLFALIIHTVFCLNWTLVFKTTELEVHVSTLLKSVLHGERTIFYDQVERAPRTKPSAAYGSSSIATIMAGYNMNRIFVSK